MSGQLQNNHLPFGGSFSLPLCGACFVIGGVTVFAPLIEGGTTHFPVMMMRLILLGTACVWFLRGLKFSTLSIPRTPLLGPVAAFTGFAGVSLLWTSYLNVSLQWFVNILFYAVFFCVVLQGANSGVRVRALVMLILGMGFLEGGLGIVQYVWVGEPRAHGTFFNPNFFATYEVVSCVLALGLLTGTQRANLRLGETLFLVLTAAISCGAMVLAQSRGGAAAFLIGVLFVGLYRYGKAALVFFLILLVSGVLIPNPIKQRILDVSMYDPYAYTRFEMWADSLDRIIDHPLGVGLGTYKYGSFQHRFPIEHAIVRYGKRAESAHNEYLQVASELGVGGLGLFLVCIGFWVREARRLLEGSLSRWDRGAAVGLCGGIVAILVHAGVDSVFHEPALVLLLILLGGLILVLRQLNSFPQPPEWRCSFPYSRARLALILFSVGILMFLAIQPAAAWFASEQGQSALRRGDNRAALDWYRRAALIDPGATAMHDAVARLYLSRFSESGDPSWLVQAIGEWEICMVLSPLDGRSPYRLGAVYLLLSEHQTLVSQRNELLSKAIDALEKAITVDPFSPFSYLELGKVRRRQGDKAAAQTLLVRAIAYEPNFLPARRMLAELAMEMGQPESAAAQQASIRDIQLKYRDRTLSYLEQQYLAVNSGNMQ